MVCGFVKDTKHQCFVSRYLYMFSLGYCKICLIKIVGKQPLLVVLLRLNSNHYIMSSIRLCHHVW